MKEYNAAFFGLFENVFITLKAHFDENTALKMFREIMVKGLSKAYGNDFIKGEPHEYVRLVGERDNNVGLCVKFPVVETNHLIYQFHDDPFPNLKGLVNHALLDATYMDFKVKTILGKEWSYLTTKHLWNGDQYTEHVISKK